eukprot:Clim_evm45s33 gene=Clim_evmTU45s33
MTNAVYQVTAGNAIKPTGPKVKKMDPNAEEFVDIAQDQGAPAEQKSDSLKGDEEEELPLPNAATSATGPTAYGYSEDGQPPRRDSQVRIDPEATFKFAFERLKLSSKAFFEYMGKLDKSGDSEIDERVQEIQDSRKGYAKLALQLENMVTALLATIHAASALGVTIDEMSQKEEGDGHTLGSESATLLDSLGYMDRSLAICIVSFLDRTETMLTRTMEDVMASVKSLNQISREQKAVEQEIQRRSANKQDIAVTEEKLKDVTTKVRRVKDDLTVKMDMFQVNREAVLRSQMLILRDALSAMLSGDHKNIDAVIEEHHLGHYGEVVDRRRSSVKSQEYFTKLRDAFRGPNGN